MTVDTSYRVNNLWLYIDSSMSFNTHIEEMCKKVTGILMYVNRIGNTFDWKTRTQIVESIALSIMNYCIIIWGSTADLYLDKAQKIQNFAARVAVGGVRKYDHITPAFEKLKWLKIKQKHIYDTCVMMYKFLNDRIPNWLIRFPTVGEVLTARTRQRDDLYIERTRTALGGRDFKAKGPFTWNKLPTHLKSIRNLSSFKTKTRNNLLELQNS